MILLPWPASLLCLLLGYVGVNPALQADVEKPAVRQIPVTIGICVNFSTQTTDLFGLAAVT